MKRYVFSLLLAAVCSSALAADLVDWQSGQVRTTSSLKAPVRVINLWATWCGPCRKEMPAMSAWYQKQKKGTVDMVGIALDSSDNIQRFLKAMPVVYPIWRYAGNDSRAWMKTQGNQVGALPFTQVAAPNCRYSQTILGEVTAAKLDKAVRQVRKQCA